MRYPALQEGMGVGVPTTLVNDCRCDRNYIEFLSLNRRRLEVNGREKHIQFKQEAVFFPVDIQLENREKLCSLFCLCVPIK